MVPTVVVVDVVGVVLLLVAQCRHLRLECRRAGLRDLAAGRVAAGVCGGLVQRGSGRPQLLPGSTLRLVVLAAADRVVAAFAGGVGVHGAD